jgi:putative endonuclease
VSAAKQRSVIFAARCYLRAFASPPACRFDVVAIEGAHIEWLRGAFDAA